MMSDFNKPLASTDDSEKLIKSPPQNESNNIRISSDSTVYLSAENEQQLSLPKISHDEDDSTMIVKNSTIQNEASNTLTPNNDSIIPDSSKGQLAKSKTPQDVIVKSPLRQEEGNNIPSNRSNLMIFMYANENVEEEITRSKTSKNTFETNDLTSLDDGLPNQINDKTSFEFLDLDTEETYYSVPSPKEIQQTLFEDQMVLINKEFINDLSINYPENGKQIFEPLITSTQKQTIDMGVQIESPYFKSSEGFGSMDVHVGTEEFVTDRVSNTFDRESNALKNLKQKNLVKKRNEYMLLIDQNFENKLKETSSDMSLLEDAEDLNFMPIKRRKPNTSSKVVESENTNTEDENRHSKNRDGHSFENVATISKENINEENLPKNNQDVRKENDTNLRQMQSKNEKLFEKKSTLNLKNLENQSDITKLIAKENIKVGNLSINENSRKKDGRSFEYVTTISKENIHEENLAKNNQGIEKEYDKNLRKIQSKNEKLIEKESTLNLKNLENQSDITKIITKANIKVGNLPINNQDTRKENNTNLRQMQSKNEKLIQKETTNVIFKTEISEKARIIIKFNSSDALKEVNYNLSQGDFIEVRTLIKGASTSITSKNTDEMIQIEEIQTSIGNQLNMSDNFSDVSIVENSDDESCQTVFIKPNKQTDKNVKPQEVHNLNEINETVANETRKQLSKNDKRELQNNNPDNSRTCDNSKEINETERNEAENQCLLQFAIPGPRGENVDDFENRFVKFKCFDCYNLCENVIKKRIGKSKHIVVCQCASQHLIRFNEKNKLNCITKILLI